MKPSLRIPITMLVLGVAACSGPPSPTVSDPESPVVEEITYVVREGDSWGSVSEAFFGDASRAERIARVNGIHPAIDPVPSVEIIVSIRSDELQIAREIAAARGPYNAGVEAMQRAVKRHGSVVLVSQGLEQVVRPLAQYLGVEHFISNRLDSG